MLGILGVETKRALGLLLGNHGLLVADNSVLGLYRRLNSLEKTLWEWIEHVGAKRASVFSDYLDEECKSEIVWHMRHNWRVTPDHVVFLGSSPSSELFSLTNFGSLEAYVLEMTSKLHLSQVQQDQLRWYLQLSRVWREREKLHTLPKGEAEFLQNWAPEKLRQEISLGA
jgi:rhamnose utilization protein RhaD (predicted bifunctional aldolase and dehydrogenase)